MLGHFTVDSYTGLLPVLYPLLIDRFQLNLATVGLVTLAYGGVAAITQPAFGWLADRFGTRLTGVTLAWTAVVFGAVGFAPSFPVLLGLAAAAGLGSGAFHPMGAMNVGSFVSERSRNTSMSVYVTGGTLGVALGPLIGVVLFTVFGVRGTAVMVLPGLSIGAFLLWQLRKLPARRAPGPSVAARPPPVPMFPLAMVIAVMMSRTWTVSVLQAFIPTWYQTLGYHASFYGPLATVVVLASAIGTVGTGSLANRYGRRGLILATLVLSIPAILLFAQFTGPIGFLTGAAVGALAASTAPLSLIMAQELMAGRRGLASGLILGLGFVTGAIGVPLTGAVADHIGLTQAIRLQVVIVLLTIPVAWMLPTDGYLRALRKSRVVALGAAP